MEEDALGKTTYSKDITCPGCRQSLSLGLSLSPSLHCAAALGQSDRMLPLVHEQTETFTGRRGLTAGVSALLSKLIPQTGEL